MAMDGQARRALVWKAATWLRLGKVDPALDLLETLAGPELDDWSLGVVRGTRRLRAAHEHLRRAALLEAEGDTLRAALHWAQADLALADAVADLGGPPPAVEARFGVPDPWPHVVGGFREHVEGQRRHRLASRAVGLEG